MRRKVFCVSATTYSTGTPTTSFHVFMLCIHIRKSVVVCKKRAHFAAACRIVVYSTNRKIRIDSFSLCIVAGISF